VSDGKPVGGGGADSPARGTPRGATIGTILCVDDQAEVRRLLADVFRARGRSVVGFDDGEDAIGDIGQLDPLFRLNRQRIATHDEAAALRGRRRRRDGPVHG